jgi:hypothetical protein
MTWTVYSTSHQMIGGRTGRDRSCELGNEGEGGSPYGVDFHIYPLRMT